MAVQVLVRRASQRIVSPRTFLLQESRCVILCSLRKRRQTSHIDRAHWKLLTALPQVQLHQRLTLIVGNELSNGGTLVKVDRLSHRLSLLRNCSAVPDIWRCVFAGLDYCLLRRGIFFISLCKRKGPYLRIQICVTAQVALKLHCVWLLN